MSDILSPAMNELLTLTQTNELTLTLALSGMLNLTLALSTLSIQFQQTNSHPAEVSHRYALASCPVSLDFSFSIKLATLRESAVS